MENEKKEILENEAIEPVTPVAEPEKTEEAVAETAAEPVQKTVAEPASESAEIPVLGLDQKRETTEKVSDPSEPVKEKDSKFENKVTLKGTIARIDKNPKSVRIVLAIRTRTTVTDYPAVMFFTNLEEAAKFNRNDRVVIRGYFQAYGQTVGNSTRPAVLIVGNEIEREKAPADSPVVVEDLEHYIDKPMSIFHDKAEFELKGRVVGIVSNEATKEITVSIQVRMPGGRSYFFTFPYIARNRELFFSNIRVHQFVKARGLVETINAPINESEKAEENEKPTVRGKARTRNYVHITFTDLFSI